MRNTSTSFLHDSRSKRRDAFQKFKFKKEQIMRKWHFFLCDISIFSSSYNNKSIILQQRRYLYSQIASRTREQRKREIYTRDLHPYSCNNQIINIQRGFTVRDYFLFFNRNFTSSSTFLHRKRAVSGCEVSVHTLYHKIISDYASSRAFISSCTRSVILKITAGVRSAQRWWVMSVI
jgi:hypothetical protein